LYFADKAILIEGATERILMPVLLDKVDLIDSQHPKLTTQYITVLEVGGAYAHHFSKFLDFLELRTLVVTDLDSVSKDADGKGHYKAVEVVDGTHSSNAAIKNWFTKDISGHIALTDCTGKNPSQKVIGCRRIAYQIPEPGKTCCARSFEDAFILANRALFALEGDTDKELATNAYNQAIEYKNLKTDFALKYGLEELRWTPPHYLIEGLQWLAENPNIPAQEIEEAMVSVIEESSDTDEKQ
jgi:putative ATP-dependent endonuclease of OLD family